MEPRAAVNAFCCADDHGSFFRRPEGSPAEEREPTEEVGEPDRPFELASCCAFPLAMRSEEDSGGETSAGVWVRSRDSRGDAHALEGEDGGLGPEGGGVGRTGVGRSGGAAGAGGDGVEDSISVLLPLGLESATPLSRVGRPLERGESSWSREARVWPPGERVGSILVVVTDSVSSVARHAPRTLALLVTDFFSDDISSCSKIGIDVGSTFANACDKTDIGTPPAEAGRLAWVAETANLDVKKEVRKSGNFLLPATAPARLLQDAGNS